MSDAKYVSEELAKFFKDSPEKIGLWILTPNPMFGGISAAQLFTVGRGHKVAQFIKAAMWENSQPDPAKLPILKKDE